jgi:hypothetical protein
MKKIIDLAKTYKLQLLILLTVIFFFRSCGNSRRVDELEKLKVENSKTIDSLSMVVKAQKDSIKIEKIKIHSYYDNWITEKNRGPQLMELHFLIKNNLKELEQSK